MFAEFKLYDEGLKGKLRDGMEFKMRVNERDGVHDEGDWME